MKKAVSLLLTTATRLMRTELVLSSMLLRMIEFLLWFGDSRMVFVARWEITGRGLSSDRIRFGALRNGLDLMDILLEGIHVWFSYVTVTVLSSSPQGRMSAAGWPASTNVFLEPCVMHESLSVIVIGLHFFKI